MSVVRIDYRTHGICHVSAVCGVHNHYTRRRRRCSGSAAVNQLSVTCSGRSRAVYGWSPKASNPAIQHGLSVAYCTHIVISRARDQVPIWYQVILCHQWHQPV